MPEVSVIIPVFNKQDYIDSCIRSVLQQTFTDFELILVNDGSTDNSVEVINSFSDPRIKVLDQKNMGPGVARNKGLAAAKSEFIAFLDADDTWENTFIATGMERIRSSGAAIFLCGAKWTGWDERLPYLENEASEKGIWEVPTDLDASELFDVMNFFAMGSVICRKQVIDNYGGLFDEYRCTSGEDGYLWIQVMLNHPIFREPQLLLTVNTEGSFLGIARKGLKPIPPALTHPDKLFDSCPPQHKESLRRLLDYMAFQAFRRELYKLNVRKARKLQSNFPDLRKYREEGFPPIFWSYLVIPLRKIMRGVWARIRGK